MKPDQPIDCAALCTGITHGMAVDLDAQYGALAHAMLFDARQAPAAGAQLVGVAAALALRLGTAACLGELQGHARLDALADYAVARERLRHAYKRADTGRPGQPRGAERWADCTLHVIRLDRALYDLCYTSDAQTAARLIAQLDALLDLRLPT